ncbi:MnuA family membrane nuclease [Mycoplasmopsis sturni]|uniref:MnuA family membrane nuclease n=1 Tax=Mycoplasmopsis sturni TaxID=39047 RepID=UPI00055FD186|nr:hypothetical protein [Mycoplasmopsis sturni]
MKSKKSPKSKKWKISLLGSSIIVLGAAAGVGYSLYQRKAKNSQTNVSNDKTVYEQIKSYELKTNHYRILHWNVLNFGGSKHVFNSFKVVGIAQILVSSNATVMGLTEINNGDTKKVKLIVDAMNKIKPNTFDYIVQDPKEATSSIYPKSKESIAIIYDKNKVKPSKFKNGNIGESYKHNYKLQESNSVYKLSSENDEYVRPLFGIEFQIINSKSKTKFFTTFFGHLDSPSASNNEYNISKGELKSPQKTYKINNVGSKELQEVINLPEAFMFFKGISNSNNIIFGGDTNINASAASSFDYIAEIGNLNNYYPASEAKKEKFLTSLTTVDSFKRNPKKYPYVNGYDKWIFSEDNLDFLDQKEDPDGYFKIDIAKAFNNQLLNREEMKKRYIRDYQKSTNPDDKNPTDFRMIRIGLSDHAPIMIDFQAKK